MPLQKQREMKLEGSLLIPDLQCPAKRLDGQHDGWGPAVPVEWLGHNWPCLGFPALVYPEDAPGAPAL